MSRGPRLREARSGRTTSALLSLPRNAIIPQTVRSQRIAWSTSLAMGAPETVPVIYSIGHSDHDLETFIDLLHTHMITTVVDVRSQPYSRRVPVFNREHLERVLARIGLRYEFMGDTLGGRPSNPALYPTHRVEGRPDYRLAAETDQFRAGIRRLLSLARSARVVMMCSEGDPGNCHRSALITPALLKLGARVIHVRRDDTTMEAKLQPVQEELF